MANEYTSSINTVDDGSLKGKAQQAISTVQEKAGEQIETRITDQKARAADKLSGVAQSLLTSSQQLRTDGNEDVSRYIERAADQVDRLASYLQRADVHQVMDQVEGFARRQPAAFVASAFAVGFLASRFLKSSRGEVGYRDTGRNAGFEAGSNFELSRGYGSSAPRTVRYDESANWRNTGYAASSTNPSHERDVIGDPAARTTPGHESGEGMDRGGV
ncbi:MAG TPA: hypothetical protein VF021_12615 [Longimicrobiales bacterium]